MSETTTAAQVFLEEYLDYLRVERRLAENTIVSYRSDLELFMEFLGGTSSRVGLSETGHEEVQEYLRWLNAKHLSPRSRARNLSALRGFFRYLRMEGEVKGDPTEWIEAPKGWKRLPRLLTAPEVELLLSAPDTGTPAGMRDALFLELLYDCGLRVTELVSLKVGQLDLEAWHIRVMGKGERERYVPFGEEALDSITRYLRDARPRMAGEAANPFLFPGRRKGHFTRQADIRFILVAAIPLLAGYLM